MIIIETSVFTKRVQEILSDEEYRELQAVLVDRPKAGNIIPGSGGVRNIRWKAAGHDKRGGARVIYYWATEQDRILHVIYAKNEMDDLTPKQLQALRQIMESEYR